MLITEIIAKDRGSHALRKKIESRTIFKNIKFGEHTDMLWKYRVESLGAMFALWAIMGMMVNAVLDHFRPHVMVSEKVLY